ncbi:MAG: amidohydrolase [Anaerolineaceae bacterium]|nr:amidohydrolase [Anaerolineaceae bacterium]
MIIDADCHISPHDEGATTITIDELLRRMDRSGVDKAIVWLKPPYMREVAPSNAYIAKAMRDHPDRILGFGWVDPWLGVEKMKDEVKRCVDEYGFYGVKLNGAQNSYFIDDPKKSMPLVEAIAATGKMLAFHIGADAFDATNPYRMGKIARMFPQTQMFMIHMGGVGHHDVSAAALEVIEDNPNITGIGSAIKYSNLLKSLKQLGASRVCFGSDTPFNLMRVELAAYRAMMDGELSEAEQALVFSGNVKRLLNLND